MTANEAGLHAPALMTVLRRPPSVLLDESQKPVFRIRLVAESLD